MGFRVWFSHRSVRTKIVAAVGGGCGVALIILMLALKDVRAGQMRAEALHQHNLVPMVDLTKTRVAVLRMYVESDALIGARPDEQPAQQARLAEVDRAYDEAWGRFRSHHTEDGQRPQIDEYTAKVEDIRATRRRIAAAVQGADKAGAERALTELRQQIVALGGLGNQLLAENVQEADASLKAGQAAFIRAYSGGITFSVLGISLSVLLGFFFFRDILGSLKAFSGVLDAVAAGDLTQRAQLDSRDEFGQLGRTLNRMVDQLRGLLKGVQDSVEGFASGAIQLSASAEQMAVSSGEIAQSAERQRLAMDTTVTAMQQLSTSIEEVKQGALASLGQLQEALRATEASNQSGAATTEAMQEIKVTADRISQAVTVIQDIARQTNLLSLNAAIEAAKAGEHGKGFAVVAEEVRKLAERSGVSAKEIGGHIAEARSAVDQGGATVASTVTIMQQIKTYLEGFSAHTHQANLAAREQAQAGAEVAQQMETGAEEARLTAVAIQEMAASTTEVARTAGELTGLAERLQSQVRQFRYA